MDDTADTRLFLFGILRELKQTTKKLGLVEHTDIVWFRLAAQRDGQAGYGALCKACKLTTGQMASAVASLVEAGYVARVHDSDDARRLVLALTKKARDAYRKLITTAAESAEEIDR